MGFKKCSDCEVDLVENSGSKGLTAVAPKTTEDDSETFGEFWRGEDARVNAELCGLLVEAEIPYQTFEWQDHVFNRVRFPVFRIAVPLSMFEKAESVVEEAYGGAESADNVMHPTPENRPETKRLLELSWKEALQEFPPTEKPSLWQSLTGKKKERDREEPEEDGSVEQ